MNYLHAGNGKMIRISSIVGIFDMDRATKEVATRELLKRAQNENILEMPAEEIPKSVILYGKGEERVCMSQLSVNTLVSRCKIKDN